MDTRRLYLLRHVKSSWDDASIPDRDRRLAPRGHRAGAALQAHLRDTQTRVDLVLRSPARRTIETWEAVRDGLDPAPDLRTEPSIYEATPATLLSLLQATSDDIASLLMIGHNPGLELLTRTLVGTAIPELIDGYPTGGLAVLTFDRAWAELDHGAADLDDFVRPREL